MKKIIILVSVFTAGFASDAYAAVNFTSTCGEKTVTVSQENMSKEEYKELLDEVNKALCDGESIGDWTLVGNDLVAEEP